MKIDKISPLNINYQSASPQAAVHSKECANKRDFEQRNVNITEDRPAERVSLSGSERSGGNINFKGNPKLVTNIVKGAISNTTIEDTLKIGNAATKVGGSKIFNGLLQQVDKNEARFEAFSALVVAGMLKPICVLAMPGAEMEDKQMAATKNAVSAMIGFGLSNLILNPCSSAVNKIIDSFKSKNPTKYVKDPNYVKALLSEDLVGNHQSTLGDSFKTTFKKMADIGVSPAKAAITIALTPIVMKAVFGDKKKKKDQNKIDTTNFAVMNSIKMNAIAAKNGNSVQENKNSKEVLPKDEKTRVSLEKNAKKDNEGSNNQISFKGNPLKTVQQAYNDVLAEPIAKGMGTLATTSPFKWLVDFFAKFDKPTARWSDLASVAITFFYINNTRKSEKIDEERKLPLMINNAMVTVASSAAAFMVDKYTDKPMENLLKGYMKAHTDDLFEKSNSAVITALSNSNEAIHNVAAEAKNHSGLGSKIGELLDQHLLSPEKQAQIKEIQTNVRDKLLYHSDQYEEVLKHDRNNLTDSVKNAIEKLKSNPVVKKAIANGTVDAADVEKMAISGFENKASGIYKNIAKAKSLFIFVFTVRFLVTVLMTPVVGKVVQIVNKKLGRTKPEENKNNQPQTIGMKDYINSLNK